MKEVMDALNNVFSHSKVIILVNNYCICIMHIGKKLNIFITMNEYRASRYIAPQIDPTTLQLVHQLHLSAKEFNELVHKLLVDLLATHRTMCKLSSVLFAVFATIFSKVREF